MERAIDIITISSFNFNGIRSLIISKLKTSSSQKGAILKYKVDIGCHGNLMPIDMFQILFPKRTMAELANYKDRKSYYMHTTVHAFLN